MRTLIVIAVVAAACGGGSGPADDLAPGFVGLWSGTVSSGSSAQSASIPISRTGKNALLLENICGDGTGPVATVTSATHFEISPLTCAPVAVTSCQSVTVQLRGGTGDLSGSTLSIHFQATLSGCSQSYDSPFSFSGTHGARSSAPVASISVQPTGAVPLHSVVALDGRGSTSPQGRTLTYQWQLQTPSGSTAALSTSSTPTTSFVPDVAGLYVVSLTVSDGTTSSTPARLSIAAGSSTLVASVAPAIEANRGETIALDGSGSVDVQQRPLQFQWTLLSAPSGSTASLTDASAAVAHLTPDLDGVYVVQLSVSAGGSTATATTTVTARKPLVPLAFRPVDARYSRSLDRVVAVATSPAALHLVDPSTQADVSVALPLDPRCLAISEDGLLAVVGHDAWISYVDLSAAKLIKTWPVQADAGDVLLGNEVTVGNSTTRFAYVFPSRDQWVALHIVDLVAGTERTFNGLIYAGTRGALQPGSNHLFAVTNGLSPAEIYRYDIGTDGAITGSAQAPYWGDYPMGGRLFLSGDGQQILTSASTRFRTSDMTYAGTITSAVPPSLAWADWSAAASAWVVQPYASSYPGSNTPLPDLSFWTVDSQFLASPVETRYPSYVHAGHAYPVHGRYVFFDASGTGHVALAEIDSSANALQDYVVLRF